MDTLGEFSFYMSIGVYRSFPHPTQIEYNAYIGWPIGFGEQFAFESSSFKDINSTSDSDDNYDTLNKSD